MDTKTIFDAQFRARVAPGTGGLPSTYCCLLSMFGIELLRRILLQHVGIYPSIPEANMPGFHMRGYSSPIPIFGPMR